MTTKIKPTDTELFDAEAIGIVVSLNLQLIEVSFQMKPVWQRHLLLKLESYVY